MMSVFTRSEQNNTSTIFTDIFTDIFTEPYCFISGNYCIQWTLKYRLCKHFFESEEQDGTRDARTRLLFISIVIAT
jgi:hypothetical protein